MHTSWRVQTHSSCLLFHHHMHVRTCACFGGRCSAPVQFIHYSIKGACLMPGQLFFHTDRSCNSVSALWYWMRNWPNYLSQPNTWQIKVENKLRCLCFDGGGGEPCAVLLHNLWRLRRTYDTSFLWSSNHVGPLSLLWMVALLFVQSFISFFHVICHMSVYTLCLLTLDWAYHDYAFLKNVITVCDVGWHTEPFSFLSF